MRYSGLDIGLIFVSVLLAVGGGVASAEPHKEFGVWLFGVCALIFIAQPWMRERASRKVKERVEFDDQEIRRFLPGGKRESIRWDELHEIGIVTTDEGPGVDDVFWLFLNADRSRGCAVSNDAEGFAALLQRIQQLPDFNNEAVVMAMGSAVDNKFVVWQKAV